MHNDVPVEKGLWYLHLYLDQFEKNQSKDKHKIDIRIVYMQILDIHSSFCTISKQTFTYKLVSTLLIKLMIDISIHVPFSHKPLALIFIDNIH